MLLSKTNAFIKRNLLFLMILIPVFSYSQSLPNVIPPSPQTQELNKYIDFPVDYSTGVPEISIPLYVIKTKGLSIPITLNYHASGIKAGQDDGNVGVGWSLSSNYRVSRTIYGRPDSKDIDMPSNFESTIQAYTNNLIPVSTYASQNGVIPFSYQPVQTALQTYLDRDKYLARYANIHDPGMHMPPIFGPLLDGEYDHFNYSLPGQGGTFIISDRINKKVNEFNPTNNKFNYLDAVASNNLTQGIIGFSIKDDNQNLYSFGEQIDKSGFNVLEAIDNYYQKTVATAWAMTDIDTKYGEKIKFNYTNKSVTSKYQMQAVISALSCLYHRPGWPSQTLKFWEYVVNNEYPNSNYTVFALTNIVTPTERVEFVEHTNTFLANKIHQINVYNLSTNTLVRRIQFYYTRKDSYPNAYTFLDSVKVYGEGMVESQTYGFDYYNRDLPSNSILVPDQWGYNKIETSQNSLLSNEFNMDAVGVTGVGCTWAHAGTSTLEGQNPGFTANRKYNPNPEIFSLKTVFYPTGGKTVYEYEPNKVVYSLNESRQWGGIRIKAIIHFDGVDAKMRRDYKYGLNESGAGSVSYPLSHSDFKKERVVFPKEVFINTDGEQASIPNIPARRVTDYSSSPQGDPVDMDSRVYYHKVSEYISHSGNTSLTNGKIVFTYIPQQTTTRNSLSVELFNNSTSMYFEGTPTYVTGYYQWKKPLLVEKQYYTTTNDLIKNETYTYLDKSYPTFKGFKVRPFASVEAEFNQAMPYYFADISSFYNYGVYTIETGLSLLHQKEETLYSESGPITSHITYTYNGLNQLVKETTTDSKNQVVEKSTVYPVDMSGWGGIYSNMFQSNDLNQVIEQYVVKNNQLISKVSTDYSELPGYIFVPGKIQQLNTATLTLEDAILYHRYDSKGNVLSVSKAGDIITSYIWSYKSSLPIAQVKGANYQALENILGTAALEAFSTLANPQKAEIDNFLAPLKTAIQTGTLPNSELMTFSYDPLVGMKSQTDSRGRSTYYEYNGFGHLTMVRDHDGNILKKYEYNYVGQPESTQLNCTNTLANWVNIGSPYCETANGTNTGNQLQKQINNNSCSNSYNTTRTIVVASNASSCPLPAPSIYAKVFLVDYYSYPPYEEGADVVVRFFSDAACQNPISVTDLQVNYTVAGFDGVGNYSYDYSLIANGTYLLLEAAAILSYSDGVTLYWSSNHTLRPGNYTIVW